MQLLLLRRAPKWQPTPVFLPGEFHGQRSLVGYSPWDRTELDTTERLHFTSSGQEGSQMGSVQDSQLCGLCVLAAGRLTLGVGWELL